MPRSFLLSLGIEHKLQMVGGTSRSFRWIQAGFQGSLCWVLRERSSCRSDSLLLPYRFFGRKDFAHSGVSSLSFQNAYFQKAELIITPRREYGKQLEPLESRYRDPT
ncbi:hypothetical protein J6590_063451 [Homalodisca vitripennis]|nr:hypothetical protein J6590_063451 [Homalodisca vitripennis]